MSTSTPPLVALLGRKRSGKDTAASVLTTEHEFERVAFADPLREALLAVDPIIEHFDADNSCGDPDCCGGPYELIVERRLSDVIESIGWERAKDSHDEVRRLLVDLGQAMRALDDETWTRPAFERIDELRRPVLAHPPLTRAALLEAGLGHLIREPRDGRRVVVTDVRMPNEAEGLRERGALLVRVVRPDLVADEEPSITETALDDYPVDLTIENTGTRDEFLAAVRARLVVESLGL